VVGLETGFLAAKLLTLEAAKTRPKNRPDAEHIYAKP
jgi:hypothetical protein